MLASGLAAKIFMRKMKVLRGLSRNKFNVRLLVKCKTLILIAGYVNRCILLLPCMLFRDFDDDETLTDELPR